ncbi:Cytochrome P450 [Corchorus olitorius]|uniref:Cytochrome P450 n=1 Tax=Corchorus olitorius TaxID=93759 RepID=A0A1R3I1F0_9ROSI|nr:Cytochrome P450 [Corchorus olitorius]
MLAKFLHQARTREKNNLPPSPPTLPIIGNLHLLKEPFHQKFFDLSQKYGPIFSLRLGSRLAIVITSPSLAEECFTKDNDIILANRPYFWVGKYVGYDYTSIGTAPYGDHWRNLRRICKLQMLSKYRLNLSSSVRGDEVKILLQKLFHASSHDTFVKVELKPMISKLVFNITMRMIAGKRYTCGEASQILEATKLHKLIQELLQLGISPNIGDFFPSLQWGHFHGYKRKLVKIAREMDVILQGIVDEHRKNKDEENTLISHLLSLQESEPQYYTDEIIKGLLQDIVVGSANGPVTTLEWSISYLLNNLNSMEKIIAQIDFHVGHNKLLEEADLPKLHYLQNIIIETLRLNPAVPLLVPHVSSDDCKIGGYDIPKDSILLVNVWAIQRDSKFWDEATNFKPERFGNGKMDCNKLLPFGVGRRSCPGMDLSHRAIGLALGSLIQCFEWKRIGGKEIDMKEYGRGTLNLAKAEPLQAMCKARSMAKKLLY